MIAVCYLDSHIFLDCYKIMTVMEIQKWFMQKIFKTNTITTNKSNIKI